MIAGFVDGAPLTEGSAGTFEVIDPSDGTVVETVGLAGAAEVDAAVAAIQADL